MTASCYLKPVYTCGGTSLHSLSIIDEFYVMLVHPYTAVSVTL